MKILIDDIPENGLSIDLSEDGKNLEAIAGGNLDYSFVEPVSAHLDFTGIEGNLYVAGRIKTRISTDCGRCLKGFSRDFETDFSVFYSRGREEAREVELKAADLDVNYFEGPELDTTEILMSQLSLEMPMQQLCKPDCKGLCPKCGADLNQGMCKCGAEDKIDTRFAKLKDFKVK